MSFAPLGFHFFKDSSNNFHTFFKEEVLRIKLNSRSERSKLKVSR